MIGIGLGVVRSGYLVAAGLSVTAVSRWPFDESSGDALDSLSSNNLGDVNTVTATTGLINGARRFDRNTAEKFETVTTGIGRTGGSPADLDLQQTDFSVAGWIRISNASWDQGECWNFTNLILLNLRLTGAEVSVNGGTAEAAYTWNDNQNTWAFVAFGYTHGDTRAWVSVNAGAKAEVTQSMGVGGSGTSIIARVQANAGDLDEWAIYSGEMTAADLTYLYNNGNGQDL